MRLILSSDLPYPQDPALATASLEYDLARIWLAKNYVYSTEGGMFDGIFVL